MADRKSRSKFRRSLIRGIALAAIGVPASVFSSITDKPPSAQLIDGDASNAPPRLAARIYACVDATGKKSFTDHGCASPEQRLPYQIQTPPTVDFSPLTPAERLALEDIASASAEAGRERARQRTRRQQEAAATAAHQDALCEEARRALKRLARERRQGYEVKDHAALERREGIYKRAKRVNC